MSIVPEIHLSIVIFFIAAYALVTPILLTRWPHWRRQAVPRA
jgi:hypothetical protein